MTVQSNPWASIKDSASIVFQEDAPYIKQFNKIEKGNTQREIDTTLLPEPFFGRRDAPVVVLLLNPGIGEKDRRHHADEKFRESLLADIRADKPARHFHLSDPTKGPGNEWWCRLACGRLIKDLGLETVARNLLSIEFSPYHSKVFAHGHLRLPSQQYGFELVRQAIERKALVVCMRGWRIWTGAVPELGGYDKLLRPKNNRRSALSPGNLDEYKQVCDALREG